jgi:CRP-like cAMP-binding protein
MAKARELAFLQRVDILADLTRAELAHVHPIVRRSEVATGTVIMREGEPGDEMYLFAEGAVTVSKNLTLKIGKRAGFGQAEKSMVTLQAEHVSFFGDMAIIEHDTRSATITAAADCVLYAITRDDFEELCTNHPQVGVKVLRRVARVLSKRVRDGNQDVLKLTTALSVAINR